MKLAILSRDPSFYSTQRLLEAAEEGGHEVDVLDIARCYMNVSAVDPSIRLSGRPVARYQAVIPRIGSSITFYGTAVLRQFELMGVYTPNRAVAISRSRDKLRALQLLARKGVAMPVTGFAHKPEDVDDLIEMVGGTPLVVKLLEGTQGIGVMLAETPQVARSIIESFLEMRVSVLVQEYVAEAGGSDVRCFVVGGKVIASIRRQAREGEFRSNLHRGGSAAPVKISPEERSMAVLAAKTLGLNICGVDILRSRRGPLVIEVNSSPGLEGIEAVTGKNVAGLIVDYVVRVAGAGPRPDRAAE